MIDATNSAPAAPAARPSGVAVFFLVFLPFALGHYLSSMLRNVNAVLMPNLMATLPLTPAQLGFMTSAFFLAFALVQLPVGIALDRYGPRRVQLVLMTIASLGVLMFAKGDSFGQLALARAVMGIGLGGCFMAAVKALAACIAPARLPSVHGYLIAVGGLGAASATLPVKLALQFSDWRGLFLDLAAAAALVGLLIYLVSPRGAAVPSRKAVSLRSILEVYRDPAFRDTIALVLVPHTVFFGVQGLWLGRWLSDVAGLADGAVAYLLYLSMGAVIVGAIAVGTITEWAGRFGIRPLSVAAFGIVLFVAVQLAFVFNHAPSYQTLAVLFTLVGTITGLEYAIVAQTMPAALTGRAATCLNLLIFVGAFLVQAGFGMILCCWKPDALNHYPAQAYQVAFGLLVALQLPGLLRFYLRRGKRKIPSGKMALCGTGHSAPARNSKEDYETGSLWTPRQRETGTD